jgi:tRNA-splicing ligase RtcB (3'-phosphate/5'-hydroxy nucleic acid ligase)
MLKIFGQHDEKTVRQMWTCLGVGAVHKGVLCADGHYGYAQPVGGVVAYENQVSISGVGFDIGCGNLAAKLDFTYDEIKDRVPVIARDINKKISFGIGRKNDERVEHALFDDTDAWLAAGTNNYKEMARDQLGTVGSGNHYVDLFKDEDGFVWIGVHFGSRGLGHKTATKYLKLAGGRDGMDVPPAVVDDASELGQRYIAAMELAGRYAYAGREWVVETIRRMLAAKVVETVHNHHNYAWRETHGDRQYWVVRKGATPAFPGQRGFVGGSMGDDAVILEGVASEAATESLFSTVHGAGRICGRIEAKGKRDRTTGAWTRPPRFTREQMDEWLREKGVYLIGGDVDESPMAYRRLTEVLAAHEGTIRIVHTLQPFLVVMAGNEVRDPYKD